MERVYLDYQASTPLDKRVLDKMLPYMTEKFGNPHSSEHSFGWMANEAVENSKTKISNYINAIEDEIVFTSGATESNNLAIIGTAYAGLEKSKRRTILVSAIEHKCVLGSARFCEKLGYKVEKIPVQQDGLLDFEAFVKLLNDDVLLVSVMATNNEIGVNQDLKRIGELCKNNGSIFHVDSAQGAYTNLDVIDNQIDLMSLSGHKVYGPKGIGVLYINQFLELKPQPIIYGGGQQNGFRSGTLAPFLIVGMSEAFDLMDKVKSDEIIRINNLREKLLNGLKMLCPNLKVNGSMKYRHPGNLNITIPNHDARQLILNMQPDVAFSTGSACTSGITEPSHVLKAIGLSTQEADCSFRITVGRFTTDQDIQNVLTKFGELKW